MYKNLFDNLTENLLCVLLIICGLAFSASPAHDLRERIAAKNVLPPGKQADADAITRETDQSSITDAVKTLIKRDDVARVYVSMGDYEYPEFDVKVGKNQSPSDISYSVNTEANGIRVYIGYFKESNAAAAGIWDELREIQPMGSFILGLIMMGFGLFSILAPRAARDQIESKAAI